MTALKKAYAEIILNTAKEAAARIMASERKSHQFLHDLTSTKEEALRLLLRQKQTMDAKINEAEMKSLNQQRKIEELEAQLQEAEDIVSNLRVELNEAHIKLEEMENNQTASAPNMTEKAHCEAGTKLPENGLSEAVSAAQTNSFNTSANGHYVSNNSLENFGYSGDPVVPSIILRSKKPKLYRNGCTQRIHAYKGNPIYRKGHSPLSGESDDLKNEKARKEDKEGEEIYMTSIGADTLSAEKKPIDNKEENSVDKSSSKPQALTSFRKRRKRAVRYRRSNASTLNSIPVLVKETVSDFPNSQTCLPGSHDIHETIGNKHKDSHSPSIVPSGDSEMRESSERVATTRGDETEVRIVLVNEDTDIAKNSVLIEQQSVSGDCLYGLSSKQDLDMKNSSSVNLNPKPMETGDGFPSPLPKDRVLKYTFQRKRKKESLSGDDNSLQQENPLKRSMVKKQNIDLEPPNSSAVSESSRDSRRMAQVARQLISLSEKKWWK
ncbi:hypothetical protein SOVF_129450 [Spinacia oleracea]|nr:hypothetical protein SOVF_129450 [Spinacia oleracea]